MVKKLDAIKIYEIAKSGNTGRVFPCKEYSTRNGLHTHVLRLPTFARQLHL